jgi:phage-related protein
MKREILFYRTESGACPVDKFLSKLHPGERERIIAAVKRVQQTEILSAELFKKMVSTDGLWEIRVKYMGNIYRLLCFMDGAVLVVAAHGFQKKTQATPRQEIETAEARKKDYFRRKNQ